MKVVLFCGGYGMRLRDHSEDTPKPLVKIGYRPILWHLMKYYAYFGHCDFVLCLGYKADSIKDYFLNYDECLTNDFILSNGGTQIDLLKRDITDWRITFADTGMSTTIGGRLKAVHDHVKDEEVFLANYTDNLCDAHLGHLVDEFLKSDAVGAFLGVRPNVSYHVIKTDDNNYVLDIRSANQVDLWSNGGFFMFRKEVFDYIQDGEELVEQPFKRLIKKGKLLAYRHDGFWACMDTFKEKQQLDELFFSGTAPWQVWDSKKASKT